MEPLSLIYIPPSTLAYFNLHHRTLKRLQSSLHFNSLSHISILSIFTVADGNHITQWQSISPASTSFSTLSRALPIQSLSSWLRAMPWEATIPIFKRNSRGRDSYPSSTAVMLHVRLLDADNCIRAKAEFQSLADDPNMRQYAYGSRPVRFAIHHLYQDGDKGEIQEYIKAGSIPYVAIISQAGVLKHWPMFDHSKVQRVIHSHVRGRN